jgi:hypothetical protein
VGRPGNNDPNLPGEGAVTPQEFQGNYRATLAQLQELERQLRDDQSMSRDVQGLIRDMQRLDPFNYANDPELTLRIQAALLAGMQQVEMELRRKVEDANGGSIRSQGTGAVPQGYADAVAEYFRRLSKGK